MSDLPGMDGPVIIPAPRSSDGYVELARTREYRGKHWRKHILNLGELIHPKTGETMALDDGFYDKLSANFANGVCDIVQAPLADNNNQHVEGVLSNAGEVMGVSREGSKVFVDLDVRDPDVDKGLRQGTILGASAFLHMDYTDTSTGQKVGPTLLHSCFTNRPYVTGLDDYEEVVAATAVADNTGQDVIVLAQEESAMPQTKEELVAALKEQHGIDVDDLQARAQQGADVSALTTALTTALQGKQPGEVKLTAGDDDQGVTLTDVVGSIAELANRSSAQDDEIKKLRLAAATREVDGYISDGYVLPKQRASFIKLAMDDRDELAVMLPDEPLVKLNNQQGVAGPDGEQKHVEDINSELARLSQSDHLAEFFEAPRK